MNYIGAICPFCENRIEENEFVVFCSKCKKPHHFDCWKANKGCTTYACEGKFLTLEEYEAKTKPIIPVPPVIQRTEPIPDMKIEKTSGSQFGGFFEEKQTINSIKTENNEKNLENQSFSSQDTKHVNNQQEIKRENKMELKSLKCPNCGGSVEIEDGLDIFFCKYCGNKIILSDMSDAAYKAKAAAMQYRHEEKMQENEHKEAKAKWERQEIAKEKEEKSKNKFLIIFFGVWIGLLVAIAFLGFGIPSIAHSIKVRKLEKLSVKIEQSIENHDYDHAALLLNGLRLNDDWSSSETKEWEDRRAEYNRQIKEAQRQGGNYTIINSPLDSTECTKLSKSELVDELSKAGFKNFKAEEISGSAGWLKKANLVKSVTIDGYSTFTKLDKFYDDAEIVIEYYEK